MENVWKMTALSLLPLALSFAVAALMGPKLIPFLHKLRFGQEIREEGPRWHQKKAGTPTMGGFMFICGTAAAVIATAVIAAVKGNADAVLMKGALMTAAALGFGAIGFIDDFIKVVKKRNLGLTSIQKLLLQVILSAAYIFALDKMGQLDTSVAIPFTRISFVMPVWLYVIFAMFVVVGTVNAVNLTDGLDGLAASVTVVVSLYFAFTAFTLGESGALNFASAIAGGLLGFLIYNKYPAKVFMGDTGSLFLGGAMAVVAIGMRMPLYLIIAGFVYFAETLSVIIQVTSFKLTGKRVFKMSPIHHHFEMCGWSEKKIVMTFTAVTFVLCAALAVAEMLIQTSL